MTALQQKALAWEAFQAGAWASCDGFLFAAFERRFPKEAALKQIEIAKALHLAFDIWWKAQRTQRAASRRKSP